MTEIFGKEKKKEILKEIIRKLHEGEDPEKLKVQFVEILNTLKPEEIT